MKYLLSLLLISTSVVAQEFNGYLVKLKKGQSLDTQSSWPLTFTRLEQIKNTDGVYTLAADGFIAKSSRMRAELERSLTDNPAIEFFEPNYIYYLNQQQESNDPLIKSQWAFWSHLEKKVTTGGDILYPKTINMNFNLNDINLKKEVIVAVLDTGIDYNHEDLENVLWVNKIEENGRPGVDDDHNGYVDDILGYDFVGKDYQPDNDVMDEHGHGTQMAGIIAARINNKLDIRAVIDQKIKIMPLRILDLKGRTEASKAMEAINYAIANGADIISASWGDNEGDSVNLLETIKKASSHDVMFVASSGNSKSGYDNDQEQTKNPLMPFIIKRAYYPSSFSAQLKNVIAVGAYAIDGKISSSSNYGKKTVQLFAPGEDILSTYPSIIYDAREGAYYDVGKYHMASGTSQAAPFVTAALAMLRSANPDMSVVQMRQRLLDSVTLVDEARNKCESGGYLNIGKLMQPFIER